MQLMTSRQTSVLQSRRSENEGSKRYKYSRVVFGVLPESRLGHVETRIWLKQVVSAHESQ